MREAFDLRFWKAGEMAACLNAGVATHLAECVHGRRIYLVVRILPSAEGTQPVFAHVWIQQGRRIVSSRREESVV
jgi:hypothetical protein